MRYRAGDKVKIKTLEETLSYIGFVNGMNKYCNTVMTIAHVDKGFYRMKEDFGIWAWDDNMIKSAETNLEVLRSYNESDFADFLLLLQEKSLYICYDKDGNKFKYKSDDITRKEFIDWLNTKTNNMSLSDCILIKGKGDKIMVDVN
mgnify:CR=1 FL=1